VALLLAAGVIRFPWRTRGSIDPTARSDRESLKSVEPVVTIMRLVNSPGAPRTD